MFVLFGRFTKYLPSLGKILGTSLRNGDTVNALFVNWITTSPETVKACFVTAMEIALLQCKSILGLTRSSVSLVFLTTVSMVSRASERVMVGIVVGSHSLIPLPYIFVAPPFSFHGSIQLLTMPSRFFWLSFLLLVLSCRLSVDNVGIIMISFTAITLHARHNFV